MVDARCRIATIPYHFGLSTVSRILSLIAAVHGGCLILSESEDAEWTWTSFTGAQRCRVGE